ncbi:hypothetical protein RFI_05525 [Reticulomyxa filosa]|uniref:Uncharacterized protein n=1 Tax=Reticulomyxa filosa TaxID=46433 RepID=X6NZ59_RETFI|nr:hypothetical protein RFI_05525 [Reticulomyxa filosa]|eukprot:ETO31595.1 hypothetical protein RFI_05525 [Reticulomyxa filosa]
MTSFQKKPSSGMNKLEVDNIVLIDGFTRIPKKIWKLIKKRSYSSCNFGDDSDVLSLGIETVDVMINKKRDNNLLAKFELINNYKLNTKNIQIYWQNEKLRENDDNQMVNKYKVVLCINIQ